MEFVCKFSELTNEVRLQNVRHQLAYVDLGNMLIINSFQFPVTST